MTQKRISKSQLKKWYSKLDKEEVEQEELIQVWKNPDLKGYQGLLAYNELFYKEYKNIKGNIKTVSLKKNTPAKQAGVTILTSIIIDFLKEFDYEDRSKINIMLLPVIKEYTEGKNIYSIRKLAKEIGIKKSSLNEMIQVIRSKYRSLF
jgi:hypothetical protein